MNEPISKFESNLNALEFTAMKQSYGYAIEDLDKILHDSISAASTPEELVLVLKIQTAMHQMFYVRFPNPTN